MCYTAYAVFRTDFVSSLCCALLSASATGLDGGPLADIRYPHERREHIVSLLGRQGRVSVSDLARKFGVSDVTIRSDLDVLSRQGLLIRARGGAVAAGDTDLNLDFHIRRSLNTERKQRIGAVAAAIVEGW